MKKLIPGITDNKKGLLQLLGMSLITGVLNQRKFDFDNYNKTALILMFKDTLTDYDEKYVERWWFSLILVSTLSSLFVIRKLKPAYLYGIMSILYAIGQFVLAFNDGNDVETYGAILGIIGGIVNGFLVAAPLYVIWKNFPAKVKAPVTGVYYLISMILSDVILYWVFRSIWWGSKTIPKTDEDKQR